MPKIMKNKHLSKKLISLIGTSLCLYPEKISGIFKTTNTTNEILIEAKLQNSNSFKNMSNQVEDSAFTNYLKQLNQTEIYLLVTESKKSSRNNPILLLLEPLNHFQSNKSHLEEIYLDVYYGLENITDSNLFKTKKSDRELHRILRNKSVYLSLISDYFIKSSSYSVNNWGGSKAICPVFFDKSSAEEFFIKNSEPKFKSFAPAHKLPFMYKKIRRINPRSNKLARFSVPLKKKPIKGLADSKIIAVGLGDFINYYSSSFAQNFLAETEFLFFPRLAEIDSHKKSQMKTTSTKETFRFYQKMYYKLKS